MKNEYIYIYIYIYIYMKGYLFFMLTHDLASPS